MSIVLESDVSVNGVTFTVEDREDGQYLPTLYKTDKRGLVNCWEIRVADDKVCRRSWVQGGVVKEYAPEKCVAMNVGRSNATTPHTQALFQAYADWKLKRDKCYALEPGIAAPLRPMLAQTYPTRAHYLVYPCAVSPKIDGIRSLAFLEDEKLVMPSRNGKEFVFLQSIKASLSQILDKYPDLVLDGEIYSHNMTFNLVSGITRSKNKPHPRDGDVEFWIFDIVNDEPYEARMKLLQKISEEFPLANLRYLFYTQVTKPEEFKIYHDSYVSQGYEGLIIRNLKGKYDRGHRSNDLQKYKEFEDREFKVVGVEEGVGAEEGCALFVCLHESGKTFPVRPRGSHEHRKKQFLRKDSYIGKMLTVRYQPINEDVLPRFPVGIGFRDYE
jgi:DNA ligase 1